MLSEKNKNEEKYLDIVFKLLYLIIALMLLTGALLYIYVGGVPDIFKSSPPEKITSKATPTKDPVQKTKTAFWIAPDTSTISNDEAGNQIRYGRMLIVNTSYYLGPQGIVKHISNGMNCQNCHLDAGAKLFGNNYSAVASTYPKFRERSGMIESIYKRVNDCFERSLNGTALDTTSKEMQAIKAYIVWLGKDVKKGEKPEGVGIKELAYLDREADPNKGKTIYTEKCKSCHGENGEGKIDINHSTYQYPPLWGEHSYNNGAGLFRLSRTAGYVKLNMPFGVAYDNPQLTDEEAWDVSAYIDSQKRPSKDLSKDWPGISGKPIDQPFGPYSDSFSEKQHKYGPFGPIAEFKRTHNKKIKK